MSRALGPGGSHPVALVTGASRGIGAETARQLAARGCDVVLVFRSKAPRAAEVALELRAAGRRALPLQADLTDPQALAELAGNVRAWSGEFDLLVLNASGGLEKGKPPDYAMQLNRTAQIATVEVLLPLMRPGGVIVFVTSHWAHFHGVRPVLIPAYEPIAASKRAGEDALRARLPEFTRRGLRLLVVSGDAIEGTITPKLLERADRDYRAERREQRRVLPTAEEFAAAITAAALDDSLASGHTVFVGAIE